MKNLLLAALCAAAPFFANAQLTTANFFANDTFRIQKFPFCVWLGAEKIRKPARIESIVLAKNDLQINRDWQAAKTTRTVGAGVIVLGLVLEAVGLAKSLKGDEGGSSLVLGGAGVMLGGIIIQAFANGPTKHVVERYNDLEMGRITPPIVSPPDTSKPVDLPQKPSDGAETEKSSVKRKCDPDSPGPRITLRTGLNASKIWEIGGSEELRSDEKVWWAKSLPLAVAYEVPGSTLGHAFALELAFVSKGFREKSETTNTGGITKSRTDLQLRFLQLAALKKLPFGSQERKTRFHAQGGAFIGYATSARWKSRSEMKDDDTKRSTRQVSKIEFGDEFGQLNANRFDAGLLAGAGVSYPVWCGQIVFDVRFSVGAMNLEKSESTNPEYKFPSLHTRDLTFLVGYSVPLSQ